MASKDFRFKQFTVCHEHCAMKVGTDGVLLGALAPGGRRILDIGTGSGLVALMMAQRFAEAYIHAIDIDDGAVMQAKENVAHSPFAERIIVEQCGLAAHNSEELYDSIVCNPPFFEDSMHCPDKQRSMARHTESLPFSLLITKGMQLLTPDGGVMTIIIPADRMQSIERECAFAGAFISSRLYIKTTERKMPKRVVVQITNKQPEECMVATCCLMQNGERSEWYKAITKDFYL